MASSGSASGAVASPPFGSSLGGGKLLQAVTAAHNTTTPHIAIERLIGHSFLMVLREKMRLSDFRAASASSAGNGETELPMQCSGARVKSTHAPARDEESSRTLANGEKISNGVAVQRQTEREPGRVPGFTL
jgi:hypothetical protein